VRINVSNYLRRAGLMVVACAFSVFSGCQNKSWSPMSGEPLPTWIKKVDGQRWMASALTDEAYKFQYIPMGTKDEILLYWVPNDFLPSGASEEDMLVIHSTGPSGRPNDNIASSFKAGNIMTDLGLMPVFRFTYHYPSGYPDTTCPDAVVLYQTDKKEMVDIGFLFQRELSLNEICDYVNKMWRAKLIPRAAAQLHP